VPIVDDEKVLGIVNTVMIGKRYPRQYWKRHLELIGHHTGTLQTNPSQSWILAAIFWDTDYSACYFRPL